MKRLRLDEVRRVLPHLDELRPVFDLLLAESTPDSSQTWAGSGELGTLGSRLVSGAALADAAERLAEEERVHLSGIYAAVVQAVAHLADGDRGKAAMALLTAAAAEEERDRPDRAEAYAGAAFHAARDELDQGAAALALRRWARAARAQGKLGEARSRYAQSYEVARAVSDGRGAAEAAIGAGNVMEDQGRWHESETWYHTALAAQEDLDEPAPERWHALLNLHIAIRSRGALEESLPWLERAEAAAEELGDDAAIPFLHNARGQFRMASGSFVEAEGHLREALEASEDARAAVTIRLNLAEALLSQGRTLEAAEEAREAERAALVAGLAPKLPEVYRLLGRIAANEGNRDAFVLFERSLEIVRDRGLPMLEEALTLQAYALAEARHGDPDSAQSLRERARAKYEELGIEHMRHDWADFYGPASDPSSGPSPEHERDTHE